MISYKPLKFLTNFLKKKGFVYKRRYYNIHTYTRFDLTVIMYQSPDLTHYKYIIVDTPTKWIIDVVYVEKIDKYSVIFQKRLKLIEQKRI